MKTVLIVISGLILVLDSFGQRQFIMWPIDEKTEKIVFSESVSVPGLTAASVYANAKKFVSNTFTGERDTIIQNDTAKILSGNGTFYIPIEQLGERGSGYISFTFIIWCRDNYYKYLLTDLKHFPLKPNAVFGGPLENEKAASGAVGFPAQYWNEQKAKCYYRIQTTIEKLKEAMQDEAGT